MFFDVILPTAMLVARQKTMFTHNVIPEMRHCTGQKSQPAPCGSVASRRTNTGASPSPATNDDVLAEFDSQGSLGALIAKADRLLSNEIERRARIELGVTGSQAIVLLLLSDGKPTHAARLACWIDVHSSTITRVVARMHAVGLVQRHRFHLEDRRAIHLTLTSRGRAIAAQIPSLLERITTQALHGFHEEDRSHLRTLLKRIAA